MIKPSGDATERLPRLIAQALERQNRRLERIETKVDRILDLVQMMGSPSDDDLDEFDELVDDLRAGRRDDIPPHGTLAQIRQRIAADKAAGVAPPDHGEQPVWLRDTPALQDANPST